MTIRHGHRSLVFYTILAMVWLCVLRSGVSGAAGSSRRMVERQGTADAPAARPYCLPGRGVVCWAFRNRGGRASGAPLLLVRARRCLLGIP
ncbi:MAG: hypothetical protein ACP5MJ_13270 [Roseiflexus sp.]